MAGVAVLVIGLLRCWTETERPDGAASASSVCEDACVMQRWHVREEADLTDQKICEMRF